MVRPGLNEVVQDRITIACLQEQVGGLRNDLHEMSRKINWIVSAVRVATGGNFAEIEEVHKQIEELDKIALKVGDTLDATDN